MRHKTSTKPKSLLGHFKLRILETVGKLFVFDKNT